MTGPTVTESGATISECGTYRYALVRGWDSGIHDLPVVWLMLNPSTADASVDDPTIRRCRRFACEWGHRRMVVVNLFAYRTPSPAALAAAHAEGVDVVGPDNDAMLAAAFAEAGPVIVAWGAFPLARLRVDRVRELLDYEGRQPYCLARTADGAPRHPLYLPGGSTLQTWAP